MKQNQIGYSSLRVEAPEKLRGRAKYIDDIAFPDMLYGATIRSEISRGKILNIDFDKNFNWDEFTIVTSKDIPGKNHVAHIMNDQLCLSDNLINHKHEPIVLIAHKDKYLLNIAKSKILIKTKELKPVLSIKDSLSKKRIIWGKDNVIKQFNISKGDVKKAFKIAHLIFEREYYTGAQEHLYLETNGIIAKASHNDGITVWGSMQCPYFVHHALTSLFNLPKEKIRVIQTETGGAFGGKEDYPSILACHAALLAFKSGKHVKLVYDREEDILSTTKRHPSFSRYKTAVDKNGKLLAMEIDFYLDGGAYSTMSPVVLSRGAIHAGGVYFCPNIEINAKALATNTSPHGAFRGFGAPQSIFALEKHINDIAKELKMPPEEFRRINFISDGLKTSTGQKIRDKVDLNTLLSKALKLSSYNSKIKRFEKENNGSQIKKGIGFSTFMHGAGFTGEGEKRLASQVAIKATKEGKIHVLTSSTEMGQGKNTVFSQIVSSVLKIDINLVEVIKPDTSKVPDSGPTVASRTTMVIGKLVENAAVDLKTLLIQKKYLNENYSEKEFIKACSNYTKNHGELKIFSKYKQPSFIKWNENAHTGDAYATFSWAVYVAEVSVDTKTYEAKVDNFWALQEVGKVINPTLAEGQIEGGVAQAIGFTLFENIKWENGSPQNSKMSSYIIPTSMDLPDIKVFFEEVPYSEGPEGAKGIGELPMDGPAPAISNAIENAVGISFNRIPILPEHICEKLNS